MDINHVCEFYMLCKNLNFQETAEQLFINQSTLSKHIKALEKELGNLLFNRTSRRVCLTPFGNEFYNIAEEIVYAHDAYTKLVQKYSNPYSIFRIGVTADSVDYNTVLHPLISDIKAATNLSVELIEKSKSSQANWLSENNCNMALLFLSESNTDDAFHTIKLIDDELALIVPKEHRLAGLDICSAGELKNESFIMFREDSIFYSLVQKYCLHHANFAPKNPLLATRKTFLIDYLRENSGISLYSKAFSKLYLLQHPDSFKVIDLEEAPRFSYSACYPRQRPLSPGILEIIENIGKDIEKKIG